MTDRNHHPQSVYGIVQKFNPELIRRVDAAWDRLMRAEQGDDRELEETCSKEWNRLEREVDQAYYDRS